MRQKAANLAVVVNNTTPDAPDRDQEKRIKITNVLQTTLDLHQLLELYSKQTQTLVPHDGYTFANHKLDLTVSSGTLANHSCQYQLVIGEEQLGTFTLMRRHRFKKQEISQIETLLCCLVYPLRNALLYRQALLSGRTDATTGVLNRAALNDSLGREGELARRQNTPLSLIMTDIDYFKSINDQYGHPAGDVVLKTLADCIKSATRKSDIVFRYGGEEFVIVLSNTTIQGAALLSERIRKAIESVEFKSIDKDLNITASFGVAMLKTDEDPYELLQRVDQAMYHAKGKGRNCVSVTK